MACSIKYRKQLLLPARNPSHIIQQNSIFCMSKTRLLFLILLVSSSVSDTFAQQRRTTTTRPAPSRSRVSDSDDSQQNVVKLNPLSLAALAFSPSYERVISENMSLQLGVQYIFKRDVPFTDQRLRFGGWSVTPELRYFPGGKAPTGFYVAPFFRYRKLDVRGDVTVDVPNSSGGSSKQTFDGQLVSNNYSGGVLVGGQWIFNGGFSLEAFIGPYVSGRSLVVKESTTKSNYDIPGILTGSPVWIRAGFTVGYAF